MTELKPCPFCGGEAQYYTLTDGKWGDVHHFVSCKNFCIEGLWSRGNTRQEAIEAWNNRPSPWHMGEPTKDGCYLVLWQDTEEHIRRYSALHWHDRLKCWYDEETPDSLWGDEENADVVAWMPFEPYKEKEK